MRVSAFSLLFPAVPAFLVVACGSAPPPLPPSPAPVASVPVLASTTPAPADPPATSDPTVLTAAQLARDAELLPKASSFLAAFGNGGALLTRSGAFVFTSNRDGLPQLYVGDAARPKDPPRRLPTPNERVQGPTLTPDERTVLFASDVNAGGNSHIFRVGLDGAGLADLTPDDTLFRDRPLVARSGAGLFAYSAHARASEKTSVFVQGLDGKPPRAFYADPRGGGLADFSADAKHALFVRLSSDQDMIAFDVDVASGSAVRLYPPEGQPTAINAAYSADGARVFVATQLQGHHAELLTVDRKTGKAMARFEETLLPNGTIEELVVSPGGEWLALKVNGGNHSVVRILDAHTLKLRRTLDTPLGGVQPNGATKDGKRFSLTESSPDAPPEAFIVDASDGTVKKLRDDERQGLSELPPLHVSIESIPSFDGQAIPANVYLPDSPARMSGRLPTLVNIHGGPSASAALRWSGTLRFYASLGYAIVEPNIRGSTGFGVDYENADNKEKRIAALKDVEAVNQWARAQPWCDPDRLTIMGGSYGGYMTLLALARQPQLWRAGIDVSGMSDLRTMEKLEDQAIRVFDETEFGVLGKEDELLFEWSPLKHVDAIVAPLFVYQGVADPITPQNEADQIVKALRQRKVPVEYMLLANEGHGITRRENNAEYLARTARFLEEHAGKR